MTFLSRKTLKSKRARVRQIDHVFLRIGQCVLIVNFLFFLAGWTANRPTFRIGTIEVYGAHSVSGDVIRGIAKKFLEERILWTIPRNNAVLYPRAQLTAALFSLDAHIQSVRTVVQGGKTLRIEVVEFTPKHLWCKNANEETASTTQEDTCYLSNEEGYVFAEAPKYSGHPFDIYRTNIAGSEEQGSPIGLYVLPRDEFMKVEKFVAELRKNGIAIREVTQLDVHDYELAGDMPWHVKWSSVDEPSRSAAYLQLAISEIEKNNKRSSTTIQTVDVRFGNKIFYK